MGKMEEGTKNAARHKAEKKERRRCQSIDKKE